MKLLKAFLTFLLLFAAFLYRTPSTEIPSDESDPAMRAAAEALLPPGLELFPVEYGVCRYEGRDEIGQVLWYACFNSLLETRLAGYGGYIDLAVGVDSEGKITGLQVLSHSETPSFVERVFVPEFMNQFVGKTADHEFAIGRDVDGVTHATITSEAMFFDVRALLHAHRGTAPPPARAIPLSYPPIVFLSIICLAGFFRRRLPVFVVPALSALLLGFFSQQFVSLYHVKMIVFREPLALVAPIHVRIFLVVSLMLAVFRPRGYCVGVCPMGGLQDLISVVSRRIFGLGSAKLPFSCSRLILVFGVLMLFFAPEFSPEQLEIFATIFLLRHGYFEFILIAAVLTGSFAISRFYCRALCPLNSLFEDVDAATALARRSGPPTAKNQSVVIADPSAKINEVSK